MKISMNNNNSPSFIDKVVHIIITIISWSIVGFTINYFIGDKQIDELEISYWFGVIVGYIIGTFSKPLFKVKILKKNSNNDLLDND